MNANVIKSAEQRLIEKATESYLQKIRSIMGGNTTAEITLSGAPLHKLSTIAEFIDVKVQLLSLGPIDLNVIYPNIEGAGYKISEISE